jgi:hypothetical protein
MYIMYNIDSEQIATDIMHLYILEQRGGDPSLKEYLQSIDNTERFVCLHNI